MRSALNGGRARVNRSESRVRQAATLGASPHRETSSDNRTSTATSVAFPPVHDIARAPAAFIRLLLDLPARAVLLHALLRSVGETRSAMEGLTSVELT